MTIQKPLFVKGAHNVLLVAFVAGLLLSLTALFRQLYAELDFTILAVETKCEKPLNNRCVYEYIVKRSDGALNKVEFDGHMFRPDELAVGNSIAKRKFEFSYRVNGLEKSWDFAIWFVTLAFFSLLFLGLWCRISLGAGRLERA